MHTLHGIVRHVAPTTREYLSRESTAAVPCWTGDRTNALQTNSKTWAARMARRFGGVETVLRGTLPVEQVTRPPRQIVRMAPYLYADVMLQIAEAWGGHDAASLTRALTHAARRGAVVLQ